MRITARTLLPTILIAVSFNLAGCNSDIGVHGGVCPSLVSYSKEQQRAAADAIRRDPNGSLASMVRDYGKLRKACRV